jgi:hypothetical protein
VGSIQHDFHYVVLKNLQLFLRPAACLTSTLLGNIFLTKSLLKMNTITITQILFEKIRRYLRVGVRPRHVAPWAVRGFYKYVVKLVMRLTQVKHKLFNINSMRLVWFKKKNNTSLFLLLMSQNSTKGLLPVTPKLLRSDGDGLTTCHVCSISHS